MRPHKLIEADFEIDKLTSSIENSITGEVFDTEVTRLHLNDRKQIKRSEWGFEWHKEFLDPTKEIYKLTTINNPTIIQGLICFQDKKDHLFLPLIENAKFNKGHSKVYRGVAGNLVAKCRLKKVMMEWFHLLLNQNLSHTSIDFGGKAFGRWQ